VTASRLGRVRGASKPVRAAGGIVCREVDGELEVLLVHRPRYDDWSFPKGKAKAGESDEGCAEREVEEETGLRISPGAEVGRTSYVDGRGRPKVVRYYGFRAGEQEPRAQNEVDDVRWASPAAARSLLTWEHDRRLLDRLGGSGDNVVNPGGSGSAHG
jgi:8-oxo-dGTP diphosphatase